MEYVDENKRKHNEAKKKEEKRKTTITKPLQISLPQTLLCIGLRTTGEKTSFAFKI